MLALPHVLEYNDAGDHFPKAISLHAGPIRTPHLADLLDVGSEDCKKGPTTRPVLNASLFIVTCCAAATYKKGVSLCTGSQHAPHVVNFCIPHLSFHRLPRPSPFARCPFKIPGRHALTRIHTHLLRLPRIPMATSTLLRASRLTTQTSKFLNGGAENQDCQWSTSIATVRGLNLLAY